MWVWLFCGILFLIIAFAFIFLFYQTREYKTKYKDYASKKYGWYNPVFIFKYYQVEIYLWTGLIFAIFAISGIIFGITYF